MSVLETPRIYFKGEISWDPITTNNSAKSYDEATGEPVYPPDSRPAPEKVAAFRAQAIQDVAAPHIENWNPHGTHRSTLYNTVVCGFDVGNGVQTDDPIYSVPVNLTGMLVDLEPYGGLTSQIFFDRMTFGVDGGYRILARRSARFVSRYVNFQRGLYKFFHAGSASVIWQTSFAQPGGVQIDPHDSLVLQALQTALQDEDVLGLTVRFNTFRTIYYDDYTVTNKSPEAHSAAEKLIAKLADGFQPNPARSQVVGVIGLWRKGEPACEPGDRVLAQVAGSPVATAFARLHGSKLVLDLGNSVPETLAPSVPAPKLQKQYLGPLTVVAIDPHTLLTAELGTFDYSRYDMTAYEASAGMITLPLPKEPDQFKGWNLELRKASGETLLREQPLRLVPRDPNSYLDAGETVTTSLQLYERGLPARRSMPITMYELNAAGDVVSSVTLSTGNEGVLLLTAKGTVGRIFTYVPSFGKDDDPSSAGINPQINTFLYFRVRPADAWIAALPPTWNNVYAHVLANWNAMAPCMDNWLKLNDPVQVKAYGALIKQLTDPAHFEWYRFMPVTRDMSAGERTLLYRFLDAPLQTEEAEPCTEMSSSENFAHLSRGLRGPG